ncbi:MAG: MBL fold metallo-hydrolase, partial [Asgard group archaeon]|nr:MBL fold metallo-hydrolase [Asgard group archaeon]
MKKKMDFRKVNENLYLFIDESYYDVVVGAIILPNKIVIVDSGMSVPEQKKFRNYVEKESGKKCKILMLTHYHGDHLRGIQAYSDCKIIVSEPAFEILKEERDLPILTAKDYFELNDDGIKVIFKKTGGHSSDSAYIFSPDYKILFAGDNLFENFFPYGQDQTSDPDIWISVLEEYLSLNVEYFIPGHQNICNKEIIQKYIDFIKSLKIKMQNLFS